MSESKGPSVSTAPAALHEKRTLVEEGTHFSGSMTSTCPVLVRGAVEGELAAPALTVSPSGAVRGKAKVTDLKSQGELAGEFDADSVQLSGTVKDKTVIRAKTLEVSLAAPNGKLEVVFGECQLDVGEAPVQRAHEPKPASVPPEPPASVSVPPRASAPPPGPSGAV